MTHQTCRRKFHFVKTTLAMFRAKTIDKFARHLMSAAGREQNLHMQAQHEIASVDFDGDLQKLTCFLKFINYASCINWL